MLQAVRELGKSNSNEKKNEAVSIGSRVTFRADNLNETLAGLYPFHGHWGKPGGLFPSGA
jgi:hypothetical protein